MLRVTIALNGFVLAFGLDVRYLFRPLITKARPYCTVTSEQE